MAVLNPTLREQLITGSTIIQIAPYGTRAYDQYPGDESFWRTVGNHDAPTVTDASDETDLTRVTRADITIRSNLSYTIETVFENFNGERLSGIFNNNNGFTVTKGGVLMTGTTSTQTETVPTGTTYNMMRLIRLRYQPNAAPTALNDLVDSVTKADDASSSASTLTKGTDYNVVQAGDVYYLALSTAQAATVGNVVVITFADFAYGFSNYSITDTGSSGSAKLFQLRLINQQALATGQILKFIQVFPEVSLTTRFAPTATDAQQPLTWSASFTANPRAAAGYLSDVQIFEVASSDSWATQLALGGTFQDDLPSGF